MTDDEINAYDIVEDSWPYDGPYSDERTAQATVAVGRLVRYLNNATTKPSALPYAAAGRSVISNLRAAAYGLPQLFSQLEEFFRKQASDPTLYDDRRDRPGRDTALELAVALEDVQAAVAVLTGRLDEVAELAYHLGNDD